MRDIVDAIRYLSTRAGVAGAACRLPACRTVYDLLGRQAGRRPAEPMHDDLRAQCRIAAGRRPEPTAAVIDSQSVKGSETIARTSRGYDAGKKINGSYLEPGF